MLPAAGAAVMSESKKGLAPNRRATTGTNVLIAAVAVGACNVEAADALNGIRPWGETWQRVKAGWAQHPLTVQSPGWHLNADHHLWIGPRQA